MATHYDLIGVGVGLFNLSLAALLEKPSHMRSLFFDAKNRFDWHSEIMFSDSDMQTSYMKDLVMAADPTSPYTFMNYLVQHGLFYSFINTDRKAITRREFEIYCQWVSERLGSRLRFRSPIQEIHFRDEKFIVHTDQSSFSSSHICLGTGLTASIPTCAESHLGPQVFHAKSNHLKNQRVDGKRIVVIGGGQTGIEVFRNAIADKWGHAASVKLISSRPNLEPLDNSPFVNEYFAPHYVREFLQLEQKRKDPIVQQQKMASDGNTPEYLVALYRDLYQMKYVQRDERAIQILPYRRLEKITKASMHYELMVQNSFAQKNESYEADIIILCTGFKTLIPKALEPIRHLIAFDAEGRFQIDRNFAVRWEQGAKNKIYAMNFSRHGHGVAEPQTSLMAWRSATIVNDLTKEEIYPQQNVVPNFVSYISNENT